MTFTDLLIAAKGRQLTLDTEHVRPTDRPTDRPTGGLCMFLHVFRNIPEHVFEPNQWKYGPSGNKPTPRSPNLASDCLRVENVMCFLHVFCMFFKITQNTFLSQTSGNMDPLGINRPREVRIWPRIGFPLKNACFLHVFQNLPEHVLVRIWPRIAFPWKNRHPPILRNTLYPLQRPTGTYGEAQNCFGEVAFGHNIYASVGVLLVSLLSLTPTALRVSFLKLRSWLLRVSIS